MSYKIKKDGEWVTVANGSRMFVGSTAAIDAAIARGELKYPDLYADTSDWAEENKDVALTKFTPTNLMGGSNMNSWYVRKGDVATVHIEIASASSSDKTTIFTLPEELRPKYRVFYIVTGNNGEYVGSGAVESTGAVMVSRLASAPSGAFGTVTYVIEED